MAVPFLLGSDTPAAASNAFATDLLFLVPRTTELVFLWPRMADQGGVDIKLDWEVC